MEDAGGRCEKRERLSWRSSKRNRWGAADRTFISSFYKQVGVKDKSCQVRNLIHWSVRYTTTATTTIGTTSFHCERATAKTAAQRTCRAIPLRLTELGLKDDKRMGKGTGKRTGTGKGNRVLQDLRRALRLCQYDDNRICYDKLQRGPWFGLDNAAGGTSKTARLHSLSVSLIPSLQFSQVRADKWNSQINAPPSSVCLQKLLMWARL